MVADFERMRPAILGALLDLVSGTLRALPGVSPQSLYRMADFCCWSLAAEAAGAWERGGFMAAYGANRAGAHETALDASVVAPVLRSFMDGLPEWVGTASFLLKELATHAGEAVTKSKSWPKTPRGLSGHLRRLAPNLRAIGLHVEFDREANSGRARQIKLEKRGSQPSTPSTPSKDCENATSRPDGRTQMDGVDGREPIYSYRDAEGIDLDS
jgi:hypothetical protein